MRQEIAETVAVAAAPSALEPCDLQPATLGERCAALRALARESGLTRTPAGRRALADLMEAARAAEVQLAEKDARIRHLESLSVTDELTGLLNRRGFNRELDRALARARRTGETGVLVLVDLDHFKPINDTHGHEAGDRVLAAVGRLLASGTRTSDAAARLGGDEFAVLLADAAPRTVRARIGDLRATLTRLVVEYGGVRVPVRATLGHAPYGPKSDAATLTRMADAALYRAKGH